MSFSPIRIRLNGLFKFLFRVLHVSLRQELAPGIVAEAARNHRDSLKHPAKTIDEYLNALEAQGLTQTVSVLREYLF